MGYCPKDKQDYTEYKNSGFLVQQKIDRTIILERAGLNPDDATAICRWQLKACALKDGGIEYSLHVNHSDTSQSSHYEVMHTEVGGQLVFASHQHCMRRSSKDSVGWLHMPSPS